MALRGRLSGVFLPSLLDNDYNNGYKAPMSPEQIKRLRKTLRLTQQELADLIGTYQVTVARWETGARRPRGLYLKALQELAEKAKRKRK